MIVGTATRTFAEITDLDQPFYDFFRSFELKALSLEEMKDCLLALAIGRGNEVVRRTLEEHAGTVRALHLLTGGNPRLVKTFYRLLAEGLRGDIRADLERLLDELTPYFKAIVDALPVQQQRIFDAVALAWDPVEVSVVAQATRLPSNQTSAQIRALVKAGLVAEAAGLPKRKTYLLADRFSNIHYLMRHGRGARVRFDWFVRLVRLLFPDQQQAETLAKLARQCAESGADGERDARDLLHSALVRAESDEVRRRLLHATFRESWDTGTMASLSQWLDLAEAKTHLVETDVVAFFGTMPAELRRKLGYQPDESRWWYLLTEHLENEDAWELADRCYRKAIELDPKNGDAWRECGKLLKNQFGRLAEAETAYRRAIELKPDDAYAWNGLADLHEYFDRFAEAELAYRKAIKLNPKFSAPWNNLGNLFQDHFTRYTEAESAYRRALEIEPGYARAWNNLGNLQADYLGLPVAAEACYRKAIELDSMFAHPWAGLARFYHKATATLAEARAAAIQGLLLEPRHPYIVGVFLTVCGRYEDDWRMALAPLAALRAPKPRADAVFGFLVFGILQLARLTSPAEALAFIGTLTDSNRFETLGDALRAQTDREHLNRLAPERRALAIELMRNLAAPEVSRERGAAAGSRRGRRKVTFR